MGLAASQARFLAITSRKTQCELEATQIAQQKLSLTRDLEDATQEYESGLEATKLVWDPDGTGTTTFDLSYDLLMYASDVNNYTPFMISRADGRIALNSKMAQAAKLAGIPEEGCTNTEEMFEKFIEAMVSTGGMSETSAIGVRTIGYQPLAGLGGDLLDKTQTSDMNLSNLINYIDLRVDSSSYSLIKTDNGYSFSDDYELLTVIPTYNSSSSAEAYYAWNADHTSVQSYGSYPVSFSQSLNFKEDSNYLSIDGTRVSNANSSISYSLSDLLASDITYAFTKTDSYDPTTFWKTVLANSDSFLSASTILDGSEDLLGLIGVTIQDDGTYMYNGKEVSETDRIVLDAVNSMITGFAKILNVGDSASATTAFNYAVLETLTLLTQCEDLGKTSNTTDTYTDCIDASNDYNCWVSEKTKSNKNTCAISLSSLAESFLTFYASADSGFESDYYITQSAVNSNYVTDDASYLYAVSLNTDSDSASDIYNAEYYSVLFNTLCNNGWYENSYIDDSDYLQNALKNGQLFVTTLDEDDLYYYQQRYNNNDYLMEITDEDAVTAAELKYTKAKNLINYKEEELELDMTNLDLEISSLTTEYDTVKEMINKSIEKTFTMFQS